MAKDIVTTLSDIEYSALQKLTWLDETNENRLRNILKKYIEDLLRKKFSSFKIDVKDIEKNLELNLNDVWGAYEETDNPIEIWEPDRMEKVVKALSEVNVLQQANQYQSIPDSFFRSIWKMVFNELASAAPDINEYSAAVLTTLFLLDEFSLKTLERDELRDGAIFLNEGWLFAYATAKRRARDHIKERKMKKEMSAA